MRQNAAPKINFWWAEAGTEKPVSTFADLGSEMVTGPPVYDNGVFFVLDTVKDCEWAVCVVEGFIIQKLRRTTDKYEAIRWADEFKEAAETWPEVAAE
jgi:hypothetical protein